MLNGETLERWTRQSVVLLRFHKNFVETDDEEERNTTARVLAHNVPRLVNRL
jgi:hypothetical protein